MTAATQVATNGHAVKAIPAAPNRATRRATAKTSPKKAAPAKTPPTELELRVTLLETQIRELHWCIAEANWKAKEARAAALRKALEDPNQREAIIAQLTSQMD